MRPSQRRFAALRFRQKIRNVLLTYYLTPILLILIASGGLFYYSSKRSLDDELGRRLVSIALSASYQIHGYQIPALELRDTDSLTYWALKKRFERIRTDNHVEKIYLFNAKNESLIDTDSKVPIGASYSQNRLAVSELAEVQKGKPIASVLFQGSDGSFYKSAFAPVTEDNQVVAFIGVDGSATFFSSLRLLGKRLALFGGACVLVIIFVSVIISRKIVTPVQHLVASAQRIGEGQLEQPVAIHAQNELGFLGYVLDQMRQSIVSRDQELQMMLRGIAHEVRNPLGGIELFAGMLRDEVKDPQAKSSVDRILKEVQTLKTIVEDFLDYARGQALQVSPVRIRPFLEELRHSFQKDMEKSGIEFSVKANEADEVSCDADQMRRAFLNLIHNSIQAMPSGGQIEIESQTPNGQVEIRVRDTGVGIDPAHLEQVFDPFFTTKERGSGLGLAFVRKIVSAHGGDVRVDSTPGTGTTVSVFLPRS